jgi:F-box and WD-40 domain protein CDC4
MDEYTEDMPQARHHSRPIYAQMATVPIVTETIVTTKTITTTSYPPFVLQAPQNLSDRDPSLYPLAATPTPEILKKARIQVGGKTAIFKEADDSEEALKQVCQVLGD